MSRLRQRCIWCLMMSCKCVQRLVPPEEVKAKVREYIDNGATCPILYPLGDAKLMIDIFADGYS